ncbi:UNVERIFIED_CONTAM: hypothetical protein Slati_1071500 [Sesamum latifolium]|uniref:Uncharacterized protein n=1 Tax=Sesamum latifolium TaxID=2727402 RepID=A0AAW2XTR7_9LAMI
MACCSHFLAAAAIIVIFLALSLPSHQLSLETPDIAAAPALLPNPPLSPYTELSPDIAPLLPSPGGTARSPSDHPCRQFPRLVARTPTRWPPSARILQLHPPARCKILLQFLKFWLKGLDLMSFMETRASAVLFEYAK